jgi:hypothetical protein
LKRPPVTLELTLADGRAAFRPGERVSGEASWSAQPAPFGLEVRLVSVVRGPGGHDVKIVETVSLARPLAAERRPFSLGLPEGPYSFRGQLLSLAWTLELVALPGEEKTLVDLTLAPDAREIELGPATSDPETS